MNAYMSLQVHVQGMLNSIVSIEDVQTRVLSLKSVISPL